MKKKNEKNYLLKGAGESEWKKAIMSHFFHGALLKTYHPKLIQNTFILKLRKLFINCYKKFYYSPNNNEVTECWNWTTKKKYQKVASQVYDARIKFEYKRKEIKLLFYLYPI